MAYDYEMIEVAVAGRVAVVTISNPPVNVITMALLSELNALSAALKTDADLTVVVMRSADPDFFLAHFDVAAILARPVGFEPQRDAQLKPFHALCERFRTMNKVIIGQIEGRVGGVGAELAASFDMRFGVRGKTKINQMEVPLGTLPGGTGTQRLPRLLGRGRALEVILGGDDLDAETAERWGISIGSSKPTKSARSSSAWLSGSDRSRRRRCAWRKKASTPPKNHGWMGYLKRLICSSA